MKYPCIHSRGKIGCSLALALGLLVTSCTDFLDIDPPRNRIAKDQVFNDDVTATFAVTGLYHDMVFGNSFAGGGPQSVVALTALSADELLRNPRNTPSFLEFDENRLLPDNEYVLSLWQSSYKTIYQANAAIESLTAATGLTPVLKDQLLGEALFVRAFAYFYLTNLFGEVPLVTSTDYRENAVLTRAMASDVYQAIIDDLTTAKALLTDEYITAERVRPNRFTAISLLARTYLFAGDWRNAEEQSSVVIESGAYSLEPNLDNVFLNTSTEAIWQLMPRTVNSAAPNKTNTQEGFNFIPTGTSPRFIVTGQLLASFETGDSRQAKWLKAVGPYYYPFKYKIRQATTITEYSMVLRLAELYLIRAEARARQSNLEGSIEDLDIIRSRANLPLVHDTHPAINEGDLLSAILQERRIEFLAEWGHRWLDLKRTGRADEFLGPIKPEWSQHDVLYPVPQTELNRNPNIGSQNPGY